MYGKEGKIVEFVLNDIKHFRPIKENEERRALAIIDIIEKASLEFKDLRRESEINKTGTSKVGAISKAQKAQNNFF